MKLYKRAAALVLTAATLLSLIPAVHAEGDHITVSSVKDFYALVQSCTRDVWSQGVTVELTADLDLSGSDFQPIPISRGPSTATATPSAASPMTTRAPPWACSAP